MGVLRRLLPLLLRPPVMTEAATGTGRSPRTRIPLAVTALIAGKVLSVQSPILFKHLIDSTSHLSEETILLPSTLLLGYGAARIGSAVFGEFKNVLFSKLSLDAQLHAAVSTFTHLHRTSSSFLQKHSTASLSRTIDRGIRGMSFAVTAAVFNVLPTIFEVGLVTGLLLYYFPGHAEYSAVALGTVGAYSAYTIAMTQWRLRFRKSMNNAETKASQVAADSLMHHEAVKLCGTEKLEAHGYSSALQSYAQAASRTASSLALLNSGQQALVATGMTALMALVLRDLGTGAATVGDLVLVNGLMFQLAIPLNFLGGIYRELRQAFIDMEAMFELSSTPLSITDGPLVLQLDSGPTIKFNKVGFGYEKRRILSETSLVIPAGKRVALVGASGSGKSTIAKLLLRLADPQEGSITINGNPTSDFTLESLRSHIAVIPQEASIFNQSLRYNLLYGNFAATEDELLRAIEQAQLEELVSRLPNGMETVIGERGLTLSGGERQRVAIARALLKRHAQVIILDEATAALDTRTERAILDQVANLWAGKTQIVIAHRLSTVMDADLIYVLDQGSVIGQGTHSELLLNCSAYQELWKAAAMIKQQSVSNKIDI